MNSLRKAIFLSFMVFVVCGCQKGLSQPVLLPSIAVIIPTGTITRLPPSPTNLQKLEPTITSSPVPPTVTPTSTPTPTPKPALQVQCLDVQPTLPANMNLSGKLVLHERGGYGLSFLLDLEDGNKQILSEFGFFYVSPSANRLAYDIPSIEPDKTQIVIISADGEEQQRIVWGEKTDIVLAGWLDDERLLLNYGADPESPWSTLVFNPFTLEREHIVPDYPDFCLCADAMSRVVFVTAPQALEPSLRYAVYPRWGRTDEKGGFFFSLWDRQEGRELAKIREGSDFYIDPLWNRIGKFFLIAASTNVDYGHVMEWYRVETTGEVSRLTHFGDSYANAEISSASLSPDGRYLAFWLDVKSSEGRNQQLAVMDLTTEITTDYCIPGGDAWPPIWSPDGHYLVVESNPEVNHYVEIMVDTVNGWAAQFGENMHPYGWMKSP